MLLRGEIFDKILYTGCLKKNMFSNLELKYVDHFFPLYGLAYLL
uniref:Uncharacterized protein n=1 Tax=Rhizophora mucronata TaxID=61149 RepID=A0A2P2QGQ8_RHIMU